MSSCKTYKRRVKYYSRLYCNILAYEFHNLGNIHGGIIKCCQVYKRQVKYYNRL